MKKVISAALLLLLAFSYSCTDEFEPAEIVEQTPGEENPNPTEPNPNPGQQVFGQPIIKDSELYDLMIRATQNVGDPMTDIVCVNFVYPFIIKKYDSSMMAIETKTMHNDPEFYNYLSALAPNQPISLSYPISTLDSNGDLVSINNNDELLDMLKVCSQAAVISYCSGGFCANEPQAPCFWRVPYYQGSDNTYAGGIFKVNQNGALEFYYNGQTYPGNWIFLYVGDELHLNINLEGTSAVANYWNIDETVAYSPVDIILFRQPEAVRLERYCGTTTEYLIGDTGPAGGMVFYDKGNYNGGWRYMEVASSDMGTMQWGCPDAESFNGMSGTAGLMNSAWIANYHDANPSCSQGNGTAAARAALLWNNGGYDDWYMPSQIELQQIYANLQAAGLASFSGDYWSTTETSATSARAVDLGTGTASNQNKVSVAKVRAIRYF